MNSFIKTALTRITALMMRWRFRKERNNERHTKMYLERTMWAEL